MTRIAAIQMVSSHKVDENLATARRLIQEASDQGAKLILLPENFAFMGKHEQDKLAIKEGLGHGPLQDFPADQARQHSIHLVGGTIPIADQNSDRAFACSLMYDPNGQLVGRYDKIHLFDVIVSEQEQHAESNTIVAGSDIISVDTPVAHCGFSVCYDLRFPELYRKLSQDGANLLMVPAAFTEITGRAHWEVLLRARAIENMCFVIAANQGGLHSNGRRTFGHSMIVDHWGQVLACLDSGEGFVIADIDLQQMHSKRQQFPAMSHRRLV